MSHDFSRSFPLRRARVHEACGPAATALAAIATATARSRAFWIREAWVADILNPSGLLPYLSPDDLLLARTSDQADSLAVAEETLKDGSAPFVVIEITRPLNLREGRRLQLAAKAGGGTGICLVPEGMGSNAAETRWHCAPVFDPTAQRDDSTLQRWELIKNKSGTLGVWHVRWDRSSHRLDVVSPAGERPGSADLSG